MEENDFEIREITFPCPIKPNELEEFFEDLILSGDIESIESGTQDRRGETLNHEYFVINEDSDNLTLTPQRIEGSSISYKGVSVSQLCNCSKNERYALVKTLADRSTAYFS